MIRLSFLSLHVVNFEVPRHAESESRDRLKRPDLQSQHTRRLFENRRWQQRKNKPHGPDGGDNVSDRETPQDMATLSPATKKSKSSGIGRISPGRAVWPASAVLEY
jgi:hypothetical protein